MEKILMIFFYYIAKFIKKIQIPSIKNSNISKHAKVCSGSNILSSKLGDYSYIGNNCTIVCGNIGKYCSIADYCVIGGASHPIDWVSTSPVFHNGRNILKKNFSNHEYEPFKETEIGNDVWIGNNCLIKSGVKIHDGAVIGMGSVVTKDIGAYEIWAGNPAKLIRKRFPTNDIRKLVEIEWWNMDEESLDKAANYFNDINYFIKKYSKEKIN